MKTRTPDPKQTPLPTSFDGDTIDLDVEAQRRYLNYALSVITSRAVPDVRDGCKPVQRRILFDMWHDLHLTPEARFRKCAAVVGDVLGKYHPHGDTSVYDALVRMAQDFSLRYPLVDGHGNFGSLDGDSAAAMRYTECRLKPLAGELCREIKQKTVDWRPNYDGTRFEPIVLPARVPNLLVNGATGIAVGMATAIPPHNFGEVVDACLALIDNPALRSKDLTRFVKGPDFPTGGQLTATREELSAVYENGHGTLKLRGEYRQELQPDARQGPIVIVTSVPYGMTKSSLVEKIADVIIERKLPQLLDIRDESTTDVRIVLELKKGSDPGVVMAWLYKHTPLQTTVQVNFTCLVPTANPEVGRPERLDLYGMLRHFLDFRLTTVQRRVAFDLGELQGRIHVLQGFARIYDVVDETIKIIRASEGKADAARKMMTRFKLDAEQVDAILELKLYRLAKLEILVIQEELAQKQAEAARLQKILSQDANLWQVVRDELVPLRKAYADKRRTKIGLADEVEYIAEAYVVHEDAHIVLTSDGWLKRVRELKDVKTTRVREGDEVAVVLGGSTKECLAFFTNTGSCYVCRVKDVAPSTGYGEPVQKLFKFADGERIVAALSLDPRWKPAADELLAVTAFGYGLRFSLAVHAEPSTRAGRLYARPQDGDEVIGVKPAAAQAIVVVASRASYVLQCRAEDVNLLAGPGRGVTLIKLEDDDSVLDFAVDTPMLVETGKGKVVELAPSVRSLARRGGKGRAEAKRDGFARVVAVTPVIPALGDKGPA